jgi:hypothetical protein
VGLQAQTPHTWYTGLWSRLTDYQPEETARLLHERKLVRLTLMRGTIHLVTAEDCMLLRAAIQPGLDRFLQSYARHLEGVDADAVAARGRELVEQEPRTWSELGRLLAKQWPDRDPSALTAIVRVRVPLVQVPPRGMWGRSGPIAHTSAESWLGKSAGPALPMEELVTRYLAAFGPATPADMQTWSGLFNLRDAFEQLRTRLLTFHDEGGRELFDLPSAPRPGPETPAPPRFLYDYDNLLRSHADRTRVIAEDDRKRLQLVIGNRSVGGLLVDGFVSGVWRVERDGNGMRLRVEAFRQLGQEDISAVAEEGRRLLDFLAPDSADRRVEFGSVL